MIRNLLPYFIVKVLFGDRKQFGTSPDIVNNDWLIWQDKAFSDFYGNTQQKGIGNWVCNLAYPVAEKVDFNGKKILEVGPGIIRHLPYIKSKPARYTICDINEDVLGMAKKQLKEAEIPCETVFLDRESDSELPFADESFDVIISFNSLEHLNPLDSYLVEITRILKRGGAAYRRHPMRRRTGLGIGKVPDYQAVCSQELWH